MKKRIMAIVFAIVFVFGLNVNVFAGMNSQPVLLINGTEVDYTMPTQKYCPNMPANAENAGVITAADIILKYVTEYYNESVGDQLNDGKLYCYFDQYNLNNNNEAGLYIRKILNQDAVNNYTFISYNANTGMYKYRWTGAYWSLLIDDDYASSYPTAYVASNIDTIEMDYIVDSTGYIFEVPYQIN